MGLGGQTHGLRCMDLTRRLFLRNMQKLLRNWPFMSPFSCVLAIPSRPWTSLPPKYPPYLSATALFSGVESISIGVIWRHLSGRPPRPHLGRGRGCFFLLKPDYRFFYDGWFQPAIAVINVPVLIENPLRLEGSCYSAALQQAQASAGL